jgi:hypothetical protein
MEGKYENGSYRSRIGWKLRSGFIWLKTGNVGSYEQGNKTSGSIKGMEFLYQLNNY